MTTQRSLTDAVHDPSATVHPAETLPTKPSGTRLTWGLATAIWISGLAGGLVLSRFLPIRWRRWW